MPSPAPTRDQFGECGGGQALEEGKVVELPRVTCCCKPTVDGGHASGRWEDDAGGGLAFALGRRCDGRGRGAPSDADGGASRCGSRAERPPQAKAEAGGAHRRRLPSRKAGGFRRRARCLATTRLLGARALATHARRRRRRRRRSRRGRPSVCPASRAGAFRRLAEASSAAGDGGAADEPAAGPAARPVAPAVSAAHSAPAAVDGARLIAEHSAPLAAAPYCAVYPAPGGANDELAGARATRENAQPRAGELLVGDARDFSARSAPRGRPPPARRGRRAQPSPPQSPGPSRSSATPAGTAAINSRQDRRCAR